MTGISGLMAIVTIAGFAIQQLLEVIKPFVALYWQTQIPNPSDPTTPTPTAAVWIKWSMALIAFLLGLVTVQLTDITLLSFVKPEWGKTLGDFLVSALVLGAGTEGLNTLTKYFAYVKEARKQSIKPAIEVAISPPSATVKVDQNFAFKATVKNTDNPNVTWEVAHGAGGSIDAQGIYKAPPVAGTYQIVAISEADPTKHAFAKVTVTS